jgi:hypothetical protein
MDRPLAGTAAGRPGSASDSTLRKCARPASQCVDRSSLHARSRETLEHVGQDVKWHGEYIYCILNFLSTRSDRAAFLLWRVALCYILARDERRVCVLPALFETGLWRGLDGSETAAELTLISRCNNNPSPWLAGFSFRVPLRCLVLGSPAAWKAAGCHCGTMETLYGIHLTDEQRAARRAVSKNA